MIWKVAWRNVWRSRTRTLVVIGAVILAIWALVFIMGFVRGMVYGYIEKAIQFETSHIQIHNPDYLEENNVEYFIPGGYDLFQSLSADSQVVAISPRVLVNAMLASAKGARGIRLRGIQPDNEQQLIKIRSRIVEGEYFGESNRPEILLSRTISEKLNVGLRKKVVVTFQNVHGELATAAFRIVGIYDTQNRQLDEGTAFVTADALRDVAALDRQQVHEIALNITNIDSTDRFAHSLEEAHPGLTVQTYEEISPDLALFRSQVQLNLIIMTTIIMLALIFGIINTMLMAVLERTKELGMLMAIGMNRVRVFSMVVVETVYISIIGAPFGMLLGWITIRILHQNGIDLSIWSAGLAQFGLSTMVYPVLENDAYFFIAGAIFVTALIAAVYPSLKAIRLRPVEALRKL